MSATPEQQAQQQPVAEGRLSETPFAHLALYLYRRSTTGTLVLTGESGRAATIRFQQGRPTAARVPWPATRLLDALLPLCSLEDGDYCFFDQDTLAGAEDALSGVVDPYEMLVASLNENARDDVVEAVLQRYKGIKLRLLPGRDLNRLRLPSETLPLIELIRAAPATADDLVRLSPLRGERVRRTLYALIITHMISLHEERNRDIYKSQVETRSGNPPFVEVNEIAIGATPAWRSLASLRPGAVNSPGPSAVNSIRPGAVNSARPGAMNSMRPPPAASRPPGSSVRPITIPPRPRSGPAPAPASSHADERSAQFRKAEQLMLRSAHDEALKVLSELLAENPERAELHALRGLVLFEKHKLNGDGLPREVMDSLKKALEFDPDQPRALYTRGLLYQRAGDAKRALAAFKRVLQVDPKHLEAGREVRLAKLRNV